MMAQAVTTKRSVITGEQHFRWHRTHEHVLDLLRERNASFCQRTGKKFSKLIANFVIGCDETSLGIMEGADRFVESRRKNEHEKQ